MPAEPVVPQHPVDLDDLGFTFDDSFDVVDAPPTTTATTTMAVDPASLLTSDAAAPSSALVESWGLSDLWEDAAPSTPLSIKRRSSVAGWESEPSIFEDTDLDDTLSAAVPAAAAAAPAAPSHYVSTASSAGAGPAYPQHVAVAYNSGPGRPSKGTIWDEAAPVGAPAEKKVDKTVHGGTIIEQLIAAANSSGTSTVQHNILATIDDEDAIELLEPIEKHMHPDFFPMKYQITFLDFFLQHSEYGGINGDDMGLGKTYSVWLCVLHDNPPRRGTSKTLLIANNQAVMNQWLKELDKFFQNIPEWYTMVWCGDERWSAANAAKFKDAQVIMTTKDTVVSDFMAYSPYWMTDRSQNRDGTSCVMYSPVDGEPRPGQIDRKSGNEFDKSLISRRSEGRKKGRVSPLYARKQGHAVFDLIFVDEGDLLRVESEHTGPGQVKKRSWQAVWNLHCDRTWIMTGTPVNNNATGLLSLFELCRCGISLPARVQGLWTKDGARPLTFMEQVRRLNWYAGNKAMLEAIRVLQKNDLMRRTIDMAQIQTQNADYGRPLPLCKYVDLPVTVGRAEDVYFASVETNTTDALSSWLKLRGSDRFGSWQNVWEGMTRSRRVAALNPKMGTTPHGTVDVSVFEAFPLSEKERTIMDIIAKAKQKREQVVVATLFVECNVRLIACCEKFGFVADRFDGKMTQKNRLESMARFQEGKSDVMCMLMFAGGRGLNFQNANHLVITSPWWNPVVLDQTRRRVWRVGSKHAVVTMYNVFYDISVEQWMLQTRIRSKVMLAASLMNEEGIYGGEEAITTAGSKKELSSTLQQTKQDEMWDFLSFLRAAPTARNEIRGVENIAWSEGMMSHALIGPRCRRMMISLLLASRRSRRTGLVPELPVGLWKEVFKCMYCQDFPAVPEQKIEAELPPEDQIELARQENQTKLEEVHRHIDECDGVLRSLHTAPDGPDPALVAQITTKKQQLMLVRTALQRVLQREPVYRAPVQQSYSYGGAAPTPAPTPTAYTAPAAAVVQQAAPPAAAPAPVDYSSIDPTYRPLEGETPQLYVRRFGGWEAIQEEPRKVVMQMNRVAREAYARQQAQLLQTPAVTGAAAAAAAPTQPAPPVPQVHPQHPAAQQYTASVPTHHPHHPQAPSQPQYVPAAATQQWQPPATSAQAESTYRNNSGPSSQLEESNDDVLFVDEDPMLVDDAEDSLIADEEPEEPDDDDADDDDDAMDIASVPSRAGSAGARTINSPPVGQLDPTLAAQIVCMVQKYLKRRPTTAAVLTKKLKTVLKDVDDTQHALGRHHLTTVLDDVGTIRHINGEPHWELADPSAATAFDDDEDDMLPDSPGSSPTKHFS